MRDLLSPPGAQADRRLLVRQHGDADEYEWVAIVDGVAGETGRGDLESLSLCAASDSVAVMVPPDRVTLRCVSLSDAERRHYRKLIPFALEEDLAENTDELQFAYEVIEGGQFGIAVMRRGTLAGYLERFRERGVEVSALVPEALLLPWREEVQTWLYRDGEFVARSGRCSSFIAPCRDAEVIVGLSGAQPDAACEEFCWVHEQSEPPPAGIAELAGRRVTRSPVPHRLSWQAQFLPAVGLDLLQGDYRPPLPWRRYWQQWRPVAAVALAALLVNIGALAFQYFSAKQRALELEQEKYELVREVFPQGRIQSPERQLRAALAQSNAFGPSNFADMIARVGPRLEGKVGYSLRSISFDGNSSVLQIEVRAQTFQQIEQLRSTMEQSRLQARLLSSSAQAEGIVARIEVREAGA